MADEKKFEVAGGLAIITTNKKTTQKKEIYEQIAEQVNNPIVLGQTVSDIYDKFSKLIYVVDASGSMGMCMKPNPTGDLDWTQDWLDKGKAELVDRVDDGDLIIDPESGVDLTLASVNKLTVEQLKRILLDEGIAYDLQIPEKQIPGINPGMANKSKMDSLKKAAREFVSKRFKKNPDSRVLVYSFETSPVLLSNGATEQDVLNAIDGLYPGGGTDIFNAVRGALRDCKKLKADIGANHIVLISDGIDEGALSVPNLIDEMKDLRVVFDFIFMKGMDGADATISVINGLKNVCESTGGEFTTVETEKDFELKFLQASSRKCLPPGPK